MLTFVIIGTISFVLGALIIGFLVYNTQSRRAHVWQTKFEVQQASSEAQKNESQNLKQQMTMQFENLAQKIFDDKSTKLTDQNYKQLSTLLDPLKERIKDFEKKVEDTYSQERFERGHLKGEISKLIELNTTMSKEAQNLVLALKGENKTQGNWGELILENILERSGLRKGEEYLTQETIRSADGDILRPDVIVRLPDGKHLIVDSKMTLVAYEAYCSATDEIAKEKAGLAHVESLKRHVNELSEKKYHLAEKIISPDFVMLFMPLEPAFALAFQLKPDLFNHAWGKNIAIVSPTTLLATLRTVTSLWKQERQQKNALEIAKLGGGLYDKFVGVVNDLDQLGKKIKSVSETHDQVMGKISTGKGNLISQVEKLKELGVKTEKALPQIAE
ncbi:MAG: DNA recombination protein RmuC [Moraxellaceae bacterium]|nr:DNA recombination protein RmuC [Pseudobdellovibrionaceae bacterium]